MYKSYNVYVAKMNKEDVKKDYMFRASFVDKDNFNKSGEIFLHANTFQKLLEAATNFLNSVPKAKFPKKKFNMRIKKESFKVSERNCISPERNQIRKFKELLKSRTVSQTSKKKKEKFVLEAVA